MKKVNFGELYVMDYELTKLFAMRQYWKDNSEFLMTNPRQTSALLYFNGCDGEYKESNGNTTVISKGSVVYIPEGLTYTWRFFHCKENVCATILIEFAMTRQGEALSAGDQVLLLQKEADPVVRNLFEDTVNIYSAPVISLSAMKANVYRLLSDFHKRERQRDLNSKTYAGIAKGIQYLEAEYRQELSIEEIAEMCHVSEGTFRRLFKSYAGMSPVEYRIKARVEYAKKLLELQSMTVEEVARSLGFQDTAYFCRIFKKKCGMTPTEYALRKSFLKLQ